LSPQNAADSGDETVGALLVAFVTVSQMNVAFSEKMVIADTARTDTVLSWWVPDNNIEFHVPKAEQRRDLIATTHISCH
jgi:hypothetical protein